MTNPLPPEEAIRSYLRLVAGQDPAEAAEHDLPEPDLIDDPIEKLRAAAAIAARTDRDLLEQRFVEVIGDWAAENDVPPIAIHKMGVGRDVLIRAGLCQPERRRRVIRYNARHLHEHLPHGDFTVTDLQRHIGGGSLEKLRGLLRHLEEAGKVEVVGAAQRGRGHPFTLWRKLSLLVPLLMLL